LVDEFVTTENSDIEDAIATTKEEIDELDEKAFMIMCQRCKLAEFDPDNWAKQEKEYYSDLKYQMREAERTDDGMSQLPDEEEDPEAEKPISIPSPFKKPILIPLTKPKDE
jgi:hypothetical protein